MAGMDVLLNELVPVPNPAQQAGTDEHRHQRQQRQQTLVDARRALVLDAARAVFLEQGLEGASVRLIAKRAGYTAGAIYAYFAGKEAIYAELLRESLQRLQSAVDESRSARHRPPRALADAANAWSQI